jgi:glycosyltransferase involved in cell wall biosynthesis
VDRREAWQEADDDMRIACIAASRVPSRSANSIRVMKVCQAMARLGHEVDLWVPGSGPPPSWAELRRTYDVRAEFAIHRAPAWGPFRRWDFSVSAVRQSIRHEADLWYVWPYQAAAALAQTGHATALEVHDRPAGVAGPALFRLFLRGRGARRLLVITDALRMWLETQYRVPLRSPFVVITPSGVDLEPYDGLPPPTEARARLGWGEAFVASYTGHLYPGRGLELMLELARRNPQVVFIWAGGEAKAVGAWAARIEAEGLSNVRLLGFLPQKELPLVHAASDVLLMPYQRAIAVSSGGDTAAFASPMKAFEYMAADRPILSSDLPVFREVLNDSNAILLDPESIDAWDAALKRLITDAALRRRLGETARRAVGRYTWLERTRRALDGLQTPADTRRG